MPTLCIDFVTALLQLDPTISLTAGIEAAVTLHVSLTICGNSIAAKNRCRDYGKDLISLCNIVLVTFSARLLQVSQTKLILHVIRPFFRGLPLNPRGIVLLWI